MSLAADPGASSRASGLRSGRGGAGEGGTWAERFGAGLIHVGENRVQEAVEKVPAIRALLAADVGPTAHAGPSPTAHAGPTAQAPIFHMVGHLQSNKAGSAVGLFDRVDSVDSLHLA